MDLISILLPVKNGSTYLEFCIESIQNQRYTNWELIVINDESTDDTLQIVQDYIKNDRRISCLKNNGIGIADALETGFAVSNGSYITRMDADDVMLPDKLLKMKNALDLYGEKQVAITLVEYFSENEVGGGYMAYEQWLNDTMLNKKTFCEIYKECTIPSPSWMVLTKDIEEYELLKNLGIPEDYEWCFRLYKYGFKPIVVEEKLHLWRDHADRLSRTNEKYNIRNFGLFKLKKFMELEFKEKDELVLWGSGKKGKEMALWLKRTDLEFTWVTENDKKIGHSIYKIEIKSPEIIPSLRHPKVIVAVSNPEDQKNIQVFLDSHNLTKHLDYFFFF